MAVNLHGNQPNAVVAKQTISFLDAGIDATNTRKIYKVGSVLQSFVPGRSINGISGFEVGQGYYIIPLTDMDLSEILAAPLDVMPTSVDLGEFP